MVLGQYTAGLWFCLAATAGLAVAGTSDAAPSPNGGAPERLAAVNSAPALLANWGTPSSTTPTRISPVYLRQVDTEATPFDSGLSLENGQSPSSSHQTSTTSAASSTSTTAPVRAQGTPTSPPVPTTSPSPAPQPRTTPTSEAGAPAQTVSTTTSAPPAPSEWTLVWADEFDFLDPTKWRVENSTYGDGNHELQCYHPNNVTVSGGQLHLTAKPQVLTCPNGSTRQYSSGMVRTKGLADWTHGRFEFRARIPEGQGLWPALWMSSVDNSYGGWPNSGELDVMEAIGQKPNRIIGSAHWAANGGHQLSNREYWLGSGKFSDQMHTYTMEWSPNLIVWLVDGIEYHRLSRWDAPVGFGPSAPFDTNFYIKMNLAVGGRSPGNPDDSTPWPASFDIDWVRVYQR